MTAPTLLRRYEPWECGADGYPLPWHHASALDSYGARVKALMLAADKRLDQQPPIKDLIREQAGHRCLRCGHPYRKGEVGGRGEWSCCDEECSHGPPARYREAALGDEAPWRNFDSFLPVGETLMDEGPQGPIQRWEMEARWRILTVHHLDEDKANCRWWNLAALCQRCHLRMQRAVVMGRPYHYEHSAWFRPFAAGFYAWKYLDEDLTREETMPRLYELLALEHRFTQETLL